MYNKSTLLWEADHYEAYKLMETLRVSRDPHARVSAALYNLRLLREKKARSSPCRSSSDSDCVSEVIAAFAHTANQVPQHAGQLCALAALAWFAAATTLAITIPQVCGATAYTR